MRTKRKKLNLQLCLDAGLSVPVAIEACLRERADGRRLGHWCFKHQLHASTVSAVLLGRRRDTTIRAIIAKELGITEKKIAELLDAVADARRP